MARSLQIGSPMTNDANATMSPTHQVINVGGWVADPRLDDRRAVRDRRPGAARTHRAAALHPRHVVAVMPDVHLGMGATVGSVIATKRAIIPAAVGVDIGCGMMAVRTSLARLGAAGRPARRPHRHRGGGAARPHGQRRPRTTVARGAIRPPRTSRRGAALRPGYDAHHRASTRKLDRGSHLAHLGTLGTGNHFIEVCLDEEDHVWIMLHSGSRGVGNRIGSYFIELAKEDMRRWFVNLPDQDLAYLPEGTEHFDDYVEAVRLGAGVRAHQPRAHDDAPSSTAIRATGKLPAFEARLEAVNCHHNYVAREHHFGENVFVTRKGAVRARRGDLGIIPGSMGARSYIVRGLGNDESFHSCSHGAGRAMSRNEARRRFTVADHVAATAGIECRKDEDVIDETPMAYKSIDAVMEAQRDLVEVVHTLRQVVCVKG